MAMPPKLWRKRWSWIPPRHENIAGLADAYLQLGQRDKAMANYETAIKLALKAYQVNNRDATTLGSPGAVLCQER